MSKMTQEEFISILFVGNGYDTSAQRRGWLQLRFGKQYADDWMNLTELRWHG